MKIKGLTRFLVRIKKGKTPVIIVEDTPPTVFFKEKPVRWTELRRRFPGLGLTAKNEFIVHITEISKFLEFIESIDKNFTVEIQKY